MATKLLVGLGNPDAEYQSTRHNIGLMFLDFLARQSDASDFTFKEPLGAHIATSTLDIAGKRTKITIAKPESYVNVTGPVVAKLKSALKLKPEDIILVQDDLDIPFGNVKLSFDKNSGGHRGVESVMKALKTKKFYRLRLGTANPATKKAHQQSAKKKDDLIRTFVLSKFTPSEQKELKEIFERALELLTTRGAWNH